MTLQEQYNSIKNGKGNKSQFLKQARYMFPEYFNQYTNYDNAVSTLKSKQIISEAAGGVVGKGFDIYDWKKILAEEAKAVEKETSKEVLDDQSHAYNNQDMKNADNVNFNEIMKGFYAEMKDPDNAKKTGDEIKAMVVKNLAKDPLHYTKNGEFGVKGVGYTDEAPGLGTNTQPKTKESTVLGGHDKVDSDSKLVKDSLVGSTKKNVQDSLSTSEANTSMPKKVKEMPDKGVTGVEKKIKLKEEEIKWSRTSLNENVYVDLASAIAALGGATAISSEVKQKLKAAKEKGKDELTKLVNQLKGAKKKSVDENTEEKSKAEKWAKLTDEQKLNKLLSVYKDPDDADKHINKSWDNLPDKAIANIKLEEDLEEQKLRSLIQQIIKEELNDENDLDNRLKNYAENEFPKENWKSIKNYYLEMTQDKPEPKKAYFKLVDGILKKHGY